MYQTMIKACIFDLDGVIVDTAKYHFVAWRRLANTLGFDFDESFNENLKGVSRMGSLDLILEHGGITLGQEEKIALATQKNEWYKALIANMKQGEELPGALEFLSVLKSKGIKIGLGSASKNAVPVLRAIEMVNYFEVIVDGTKTTRPKPDPQVFQMGAAALGVSPQNCVVFEDAAKGIDAALAGGFWTIGVGKSSVLHKAHMIISGLHEMTYDKLLSIK